MAGKIVTLTLICLPWSRILRQFGLSLTFVQKNKNCLLSSYFHFFKIRIFIYLTKTWPNATVIVFCCIVAWIQPDIFGCQQAGWYWYKLSVRWILHEHLSNQCLNTRNLNSNLLLHFKEKDRLKNKLLINIHCVQLCIVSKTLSTVAWTNKIGRKTLSSHIWFL